MKNPYSSYFIRKATSQELLDLHEACVYGRVSSQNEDRYRIVKAIEITPEEMDQFTKNPLDDYKFVKDNKMFGGTDENGVVNCFIITAPGSPYRFLINTEGYDYARYIGIHSTKAIWDIDNQNPNNLDEITLDILKRVVNNANIEYSKHGSLIKMLEDPDGRKAIEEVEHLMAKYPDMII